MTALAFASLPHSHELMEAARFVKAAADVAEAAGAHAEAGELRRITQKLVARARGVAYVDTNGRLIR